MLTCLDARTGQEHYRERLGGNFRASLTFANGKIYFSSREGVTSVVQAGRQFKCLETKRFSGSTFASLAAVDGALFLRPDIALYRVQDELGRTAQQKL